MSSALSRIIAHPANKGRALAAVARYMTWQLAKRTYASHWDIDYHGLKLRCNRDSHPASAAMYFNGMPKLPREVRPVHSDSDAKHTLGERLLEMAAANQVGRMARHIR